MIQTKQFGVLDKCECDLVIWSARYFWGAYKIYAPDPEAGDDYTERDVLDEVVSTEQGENYVRFPFSARFAVLNLLRYRSGLEPLCPKDFMTDTPSVN